MLDQILVIVGITVLIMISPGPDMVIVMKNTFVGGKRAGLVTSAGILTGNLVHITYCAVGIGWLISQSILAFTILKYLSAAYLVYLGITSWRAGRQSLSLEQAPDVDYSKTWFSQGFINNILNPKGTMFYLSVFSMVITPETSIPVMLLLVLIMKSISGGFWLLFVYTLDTRYVRRWIDKGQVVVNRTFGVLLVFLGIRVALIER